MFAQSCEMGMAVLSSHFPTGQIYRGSSVGSHQSRDYPLQALLGHPCLHFKGQTPALLVHKTFDVNLHLY